MMYQGARGARVPDSHAGMRCFRGMSKVQIRGSSPVDSLVMLQEESGCSTHYWQS